MASDRLTESTESENVGALVKGIVTDLETLAQQHMRLLKQDLKDDFRKIQEGAFNLGIGLGVALIGGLLLGIALAELVLLLFPEDVRQSYRWAAYGIVGILITGAGAALLYTGKEEVKAAAPIAEKTVKELEEDAKWLQNPK